MSKKLLLSVAFAAILVPQLAHACACGCGVFDVSTGSELPAGEGGMAWLEYDLSLQTENWAGTSASSKDNNDDKRIRTDFLRAGARYMFNRSWGITGTVPYVDRHFKTVDEDSGDSVTYRANEIGDVRLQGIYSGFFDDMSTGVTFGMKLPNGTFDSPGFDRDTQIGTGSTDLLLGLYHMGALTEKATFNWFANGQYERAVSIQDHYRPGDELNGSTGVYYNDLFVGEGKLAPLLQLLATHKVRDSGAKANPDNTGYTRLLIGPGVEYNVAKVRLYADVATPIYQNVNGNQLVAPIQAKFSVGYKF